MILDVRGAKDGGPVEERARAEGHRALGDLPQRSLALEGRAVLDTQQENHDLAVARLLLGQRGFVHVVQQIGELLLVVRIHGHVLHHYPLFLSFSLSSLPGVIIPYISLVGVFSRLNPGVLIGVGVAIRL